MDTFAGERGLRTTTGNAGRNYQPRQAPEGAEHMSGIGIYSTGKRSSTCSSSASLGATISLTTCFSGSPNLPA
jgi:hypothetical protein